MSKEIRPELVEVLTEIDAAKHINMSRSFLRQDRMNDYRDKRTQGPRFLKLDRSIRYRKDHLDEWLDKNCINRTQ